MKDVEVKITMKDVGRQVRLRNGSTATLSKSNSPTSKWPVMVRNFHCHESGNILPSMAPGSHGCDVVAFVGQKTPTTKQPSFKKGDIVTWTSQASGFKKKKTGKVVFVLPADHAPWECGWGDSGFGSAPRNHRSYIVDVNGKLYWPLVKHLKLKA